MLDLVLPEVVSAEETYDDINVPLFPQERRAIASAVEKRRIEFVSVRACAGIALARLGIARPPLAPAAGGAPEWPAGLVGSMTHCPGYRAAAVARMDDVAALGIDGEVHAPLPAGVLDLVALPVERAHLTELLTRLPRIHWDRVLFSAKESIYKAWFPLVGVWLDFEQARVAIRHDDRHDDSAAVGGDFDIDLIIDPPVDAAGAVLGRLHGRWRVEGGFVVTSALA